MDETAVLEPSHRTISASHEYIINRRLTLQGRLKFLNPTWPTAYECLPSPLQAGSSSGFEQSHRVGGVKKLHRLAEALMACGREVTLIRQSSQFHPGWFESNVNTNGLAVFRSRTDLDSKRDVVILPETFLPELLNYIPGIPKILFNQNGAYSFGSGLGKANRFPPPQEVLKLYRHPELLHVLCVSEHDKKLLIRGFGLNETRVSRLMNGIETDQFQPASRKH